MYEFIQKCSSHTLYTVFPNDVKNRGIVITINIIHILGVLFIQLGILLPPRLMKYYILYLIFLLVTYILLNNKCFMTELSNYIGGKNYNTLCIKLKDDKEILIVYLVIGIIFEVFPQYSLYTILSNFSSLKFSTFSKIFIALLYRTKISKFLKFKFLFTDEIILLSL